MDGLWTELIRDLDGALRAAISLDRVYLSRDGGRLLARFFSTQLLTESQFQSLSRAISTGFPGVRVLVQVSYPSLSQDAQENIQGYSQHLAGLLMREFPGAMPYIVWDDAQWQLQDGKLRLRVGDQIGSAYLSQQGIDRRIETLMKELFGIECHVVIDVKGDEESRIQAIQERRMQDEETLRSAALAAKQAEAMKKPAAPKQLLGKPITNPAIPVGELTEDSGRVVLEGEIIKGEIRELKNGSSKLVTFSLTDYTDSVSCKAFLGGKRSDAGSVKEQAEAIESYLKPGAWVRVAGDYRFDDFQREMVLMARDMMRMPAPVREDTAPDKRVELHAHTKMSAMDACVSPADLIARAASWGHKAIAITDHGVVQAFPEAFSAAKKHKIQLIPGCEGYLIDDRATLVERAVDLPFDRCAYVVFDVETTGLNKSTDDIIELGAVRIEGGEEVAEFTTLINPMRPISDEITGITGINDAMVRDMPTLDAAMADFRAFCEGTVLVAHNADFDMAFLKRALDRSGHDCAYPVVDTLRFARNQLKLRSHKLGALCKHYGIKLAKAHRALHDARATSEILLRLIDDAKREYEITSLSQLNEIYGGNSGGSSYHIILLAKNQQGMTNLYRLISEAHLHHFYRTPRMPRGLIEKHREGLILGSACEAGELFRAILAGKSDAELMNIARFYDYLEIQPLANNEFLVRNQTVVDEEALREINRKIVRLADEIGIPCVATGDVHFMEPKDSIHRAILMAAKGFEDADEQPPLYFKTTDEMLTEFAYLGEETARRVVIDAPNEIAQRMDEVSIFVKHPEGKDTFQPFWPEAEESIRNLSEARAESIYGEHLPPIVRARMDKELSAIIGYGFSTLYDIAVKLVKKSLDDGYIVGSRGSVGSSFVAFLTGITEVNSLPPHYICPACKRCEFDVPEGYSIGLDLPAKTCPDCGQEMDRDGFDIPFEVFLGFKGDKVPDIDLNFSGDYQPQAHQYVRELFGAENVFRAGTIGTVAEKTAYGYVLKYLEERGLTASNAEKERLVQGMTEVKRTTGQHPAGMVVLPDDYEIYQFTPIQHPADDLNSETITTHFDFGSMHDVLVKLDILGHDDPTMLKKLQDLTGIAPQSVPLNDPEVYGRILSLFRSPDALGLTAEELGQPTGTLGVPEFGTKFVRQMLIDTRPSSMEELVRISGLSHGTDVWLGNAQELIRSNTAVLKQCICTRDDIMNQLIKIGVPDKIAFDTMESVRKGKGLKDAWEASMREHNTPEWFIDSCKKIKYMFPKSHAVAYVLMALRIAYFKIYYPVEYYACFLKRNADAFDASKMIAGIEVLRARLTEYAADEAESTAKKEDESVLMESLLEMMSRGITLAPVSLYDSHPEDFLVLSKTQILPPLSSIPGLGVAAAENIRRAREEGPFISQEDMIRRRIPKSVVEMLKANGCLISMPETSQISLFDF